MHSRFRGKCQQFLSPFLRIVIPLPHIAILTENFKIVYIPEDKVVYSDEIGNLSGIGNLIYKIGFGFRLNK